MTASAVLIVASILTAVCFPVALYMTSPNRIQGKKIALVSAALITVWLIVLLILGKSGALQNFNRLPPPFMLFFLASLILSAVFSFSRWGKQLAYNIPLHYLVGFHVFRILAELVLFLGLREGIAPVQLTFEGLNFDILTGVSAPIVALMYRRSQNKYLIWAWNILGLVCLANIYVIAMLSFPTPFRVFANEPSNIWVTQSPYILLPEVLVICALIGHLLVTQALRRRRS